MLTTTTTSHRKLVAILPHIVFWIRVTDGIEFAKTFLLKLGLVLVPLVKWPTLLSIFEFSRIASLTSSVRPHRLNVRIIEVAALLEAVTNISVAKLWHLVLVPYNFGIKYDLFTPIILLLIFGYFSIRVLLILFRIFDHATDFLVTGRCFVGVKIFSWPVLLVPVISKVPSNRTS